MFTRIRSTTILWILFIFSITSIFSLFSVFSGYTTVEISLRGNDELFVLKKIIHPNFTKEFEREFGQSTFVIETMYTEKKSDTKLKFTDSDYNMVYLREVIINFYLPVYLILLGLYIFKYRFKTILIFSIVLSIVNFVIAYMDNSGNSIFFSNTLNYYSEFFVQFDKSNYFYRSFVSLFLSVYSLFLLSKAVKSDYANFDLNL